MTSCGVDLMAKYASERENGEGMEPPNSIQDDASQDIDGDGDSVNDSKSGASEDELSADQWLASANAGQDSAIATPTELSQDDSPIDEASTDTDAGTDGSSDLGSSGVRPDKSNMSSIMAELLAAAERAGGEPDAPSETAAAADTSTGDTRDTDREPSSAEPSAAGESAGRANSGDTTVKAIVTDLPGPGMTPVDMAGSSKNPATETEGASVADGGQHDSANDGAAAQGSDSTNDDAPAEDDAPAVNGLSAGSEVSAGTEVSAPTMDSGANADGTVVEATVDADTEPIDKVDAEPANTSDPGDTAAEDKTAASAGDEVGPTAGTTVEDEAGTDGVDGSDKSKAEADDKTDNASEAETDTDDESKNESPASADAGDRTGDGPGDDSAAVDEAAPTKKSPSDDPAPTEKMPAAAVAAAIGAPKSTSRLPMTAAKILVGGAIGVYALLVAAWAIDTAGHSGKAMRGVQMAGVDIGGQDSEEIAATVDGLAGDLAEEPLTVAIGEVEVVTDPVTVGTRFDVERMTDDALAARRDGLFFVRPVTWALGLFGTEEVAARYVVDADVAVAAAEDIIATELDQPVEPTLELANDIMIVSPGSAGVTVEPRELIGRLPETIDAGTPYRLNLLPRDAEPELETAAVADLADEINDRTAQPIAVRVLDDEAEVSTEVQLSWIEMELSDDGEPTWIVDEERALDDLKPLFPTLGSDDQQATFKVVDEEPIIVPAAETVICCEAGSGEDLRQIINRRPPAPAGEDEADEGTDDDQEDPTLRTVTLQPEITGFDEGVAELESLGIVEQVSTFTTDHACCQNRVKNIQRFADLMQGVVIRPGEEFSLNEHVGQRTIDKGFFADGAIVLGNFEPQVGGGISQYATTFFNASFFAGVEFLEYQSHSIYISRYPRGREATISWRRPDLKIRNNTDYGILVWNEYTTTSITVSFYSTEHLEVEALPLKRSSDRQCRIDITPRLITFPDGSQEEDRVFASYRPGEGLDCNGNSTTPEEEPEPAPVPPTEPEATTPDPEPEPEPDPEPPGDDDEVLPPGDG